MDNLGERAIREGKARAKNVVTTNDFVNRALQEEYVKRTYKPKAHSDIPARIARLQAVKIPKGLLCDGSWETVERLAE
jgi:predicted metalloendopeptidase